jgi:hypothetical protein
VGELAGMGGRGGMGGVRMGEDCRGEVLFGFLLVAATAVAASALRLELLEARAPDLER